MEVLKTDNGLREEILNDAKTKAKRIISKAEREAQKIKSKIKDDVEKFRIEYTAKMDKEIELKTGLIHSSVQMEVQKKSIKFSNDLVDRVFTEIRGKISNNELFSEQTIIKALIVGKARDVKSDKYIIELGTEEVNKVNKKELLSLKLDKGVISEVVEGDFVEGIKLYSEDKKRVAYISLAHFIDELKDSERTAIYKILSED